MGRKEYEAEIKAKLKELEGEVDRLQAHVKDMGHELDDSHQSQIEQLRALQQRTQHTFKELVDASDDAFDSVQSRLEDYWSSLGREVEAYSDKLKK